MVKDKVTAKVVDEMWTYLYRDAKAFYKWIFTCYVYTSLGFYLIYSVGDRDERAFSEVKKYLPDEGRWVNDDYNLYFWLKDHTVISPVNPNESLHSSVRDRLVRFKRATKAVNRSIRTMMYSIALVLWEKANTRICSLITTLCPYSILYHKSYITFQKKHFYDWKI